MEVLQLENQYTTMCTLWKNEKFTLTKKIFRQINYLVIYLVVNPPLSRNYCQNCVTENSRNSHTVMWKNEKFSLTGKKFRQINYLVIYLVNLPLSRNFCQNCVQCLTTKRAKDVGLLYLSQNFN